MGQAFTLTIGDEQRQVTLEPAPANVLRLVLGEEIIEVDAQRVAPGEYHILHDGQGYDLIVEDGGEQLVVHRNGASFAVGVLDERQLARLAATGAGVQRAADGVVSVRAPMPGRVVKTLVQVGEAVSAGQGIIVIEAMKMENELRAAVEGTVKEILVTEGTNVEAGETLVLID